MKKIVIEAPDDLSGLIFIAIRVVDLPKGNVANVSHYGLNTPTDSTRVRLVPQFNQETGVPETNFELVSDKED